MKFLFLRLKPTTNNINAAMMKNIASGIKTFKREVKEEPKATAKKKNVAKKKSK